MSSKFIVLILSFIVFSCENSKERFELPVYGIPKIKPRTSADGTVAYDTIEHKIQDFKLINQDSIIITNETFRDNIYVADFFFTSCPTICPKMKRNMYHIYDVFKDEDMVSFISHTVDPLNDTVEKLRKFSKKLNIRNEKWHFATGELEKIYDLGIKSYMVVAREDSTVPGGFLHSGAFLLVDKERRIRGVYDGTSRLEINKLIIDMNKLIDSY